jgi:ketosteroid isomerase-like protein
MRTRIALTTFFIALLGAAQGGTVSEMSAEAKAVNAAFDRYVHGWQTGDIDVLATVYAHDARLTAYWPDPTRPSRLESWTTIRENLKDVFDLIHRMDLEFNERQIDVYGTVAVLTTHWTWHKASGPFFERGRATFIFKKDAGRWLVVHEHSSVTPFLPGGDSEFVVFKETAQ